MKPVYVDIHIHTSENPNEPKEDYDVDTLVKNVRKISGDYPIILSLTDHNMINKTAYLNLIGKVTSVILGVELSVRKYDDAPLYHCHALFNADITEGTIDDINNILDQLYPEKIISDESNNVPHIEEIANQFDSYDFMLLPHGGQSHRTFDKATSKGRRFDTSLEKSLYFNHFEGFTARSNTGLQETLRYFERIEIDQFINLITCSDNYNPQKYPSAKDSSSEPFIPTWIYSKPSFEGLRLALSENSRINYGKKAPEDWNQSIFGAKLSEKTCDIDVELLPGLNVVIGGSSSGKTLFVDSLVNGIKKDFSNNKYSYFNTENIIVDNPSGITPHYIDQNFIMSVLQDENKDIGNINIIKEVFPEDKNVIELIRKSLENLRKLVQQLVDSAKEYQECLEKISHLPSLSAMVITKELPMQIASLIKPNSESKSRFNLDDSEYEEICDYLNRIKQIFSTSKLNFSYEKEIQTLKDGLMYINKLSNLNNEVYSQLEMLEQKEMAIVAEDDNENARKITDRNSLFQNVSDAITALSSFNDAKKQLSMFNVSVETKKVTVDCYTLSIENSFILTPEVLKEAINSCLKVESRIKSFDALTPETIFDNHFSERPKIGTYENLITKIYEGINKKDNKKYKILTNDGRNFDILSPGWKTAIILDLIIGFKNDYAPLIIDQPEDNLATDYINYGLVNRIKQTKNKKQIILVTHNATIPMLADAQNVIVCKNENGRIIIRSAALEDKIENKRILDFVAEITDGGKQSIKKRVKKYDLKTL